ncbi:MAG TPA: protein kinase, partial [Blastocatellia bacterium]
MELAAGFLTLTEEGSEGIERQDASAVVERIGAYRIIRELGRGGMGTVFLAERDDDEYHNQVAIKLIKRGMDSDAILHRFRTERQILARLNHPNIARLHDGGTASDGRPYFVMEYIEGEPIDRFSDERRLNVTERLELFLQVCLAIQYSHQHLVVHRDIKPSNILVTADGTVKLLDFGIAKLVAPDTGVAETQSATGWMTPEYSSPEQLQGEPATTTSDVYSLGVVLYELLAGRRPYRFGERSPARMVEVILNGGIERPSTAAARTDPVTVQEDESTWLSPDVISESRDETPDKLRRRLSGDLDNIVLKAMHREKDLRYRSVTELAQDIRRHLEGHPVLARKDSLSYRTWKFIGRNRAGVAAAVLLIFTLTGGIIATAWQARVARRAQAKSDRRFQDVRKLARSVVFDYHDAIKDLAGSTPVREKLVKDALEYLNSLAEDAEQDASLQAEIADAYEKISSIQGGRGVANLGDSASAIESLRKCQKIRQSLLDQNPQDPNLRMKVADVYRSLARLLGERGDTEETVESYRKAVEISEGFISIDPTNNEFKYQVAISHAAL